MVGAKHVFSLHPNNTNNDYLPSKQKDKLVNRSLITRSKLVPASLQNNSWRFPKWFNRKHKHCFIITLFCQRKYHKHFLLKFHSECLEPFSSPSLIKKSQIKKTNSKAETCLITIIVTKSILHIYKISFFPILWGNIYVLNQ